MLTLDKIYHAAFVLKDVARETDLIEAPKLSKDCQLYLKTENLQATGSFKVRGLSLIHISEIFWIRAARWWAPTAAQCATRWGSARGLVSRWVRRLSLIHISLPFSARFPPLRGWSRWQNLPRRCVPPAPPAG